MERALKETPKKRRFRSLDITRGLIVLLSVFLFHIPAGGTSISVMPGGMILQSWTIYCLDL